MATRLYRTLPDELTEYADTAFAHFEVKGYTVRAEEHELGYPYTPTLVCKRKPSKLFLIVDFRIDSHKVRSWLSYCKSSGSDSRLAFCVPESNQVDEELQNTLRANKIGLYKVSPEYLTELVPAGDLAFQVELPILQDVPRRVQQLLGAAYDDFELSRWREGFGAACQVLENEAKKYLRKWSKTERIRITGKIGTPFKVLDDRSINRMTLGQLADMFSRIETPNNTDKTLGKTLRQINKDRVRLAHRKLQVRTERSLRLNVGRHMWVIVAALREMQE